jgi:hypothetical protein
MELLGTSTLEGEGEYGARKMNRISGSKTLQAGNLRNERKGNTIRLFRTNNLIEGAMWCSGS